MIKVGFGTRKDFEGATDIEIAQLEQEMDFEFGKGLKSYLSHFGKRMHTPGIELSRYTVANISYATKNANKRSVKEKVLKSAVTDSWNGEVCSTIIRKLCFIHYIDYNSYFSFVINFHCNLMTWNILNLCDFLVFYKFFF